MDVTPDYKSQLARHLRKRQTPAEMLLWKHLRGHQVNGLGFRRQRPIGRFVADFCCEAERLIVEVDGGYHEATEQKEMDVERAAHFTSRGYQILRFTNEEVLTNIEAVLFRIAHANLEAYSTPATGEGSPSSDTGVSVEGFAGSSGSLEVSELPSPVAGEGKGWGLAALGKGRRVAIASKMARGLK